MESEQLFGDEMPDFDICGTDLKELSNSNAFLPVKQHFTKVNRIKNNLKNYFPIR